MSHQEIQDQTEHQQPYLLQLKVLQSIAHSGHTCSCCPKHAALPQIAVLARCPHMCTSMNYLPSRPKPKA
eukprot:1159365-Pelagomonas_calceolata.AAC.4